MTIDVSEYRLGGYFVTKLAARDDVTMSTDLLPPRFPTLSDDLAPFALRFWWNEENVREAAEFGVAEDRFKELVAWYRERFDTDLGAPNVALSIDIAREFVTRFSSGAEDIVLLGAGLRADRVKRFLEEQATPPPWGEYGVYEALSRGAPLAETGDPLGFELLSYEYGLEHSWLCNGLEVDADRELDIRPNRHGLVDTYEDGLRVAQYVSRDDVGAEPGTWLPWLLVRYPLTTS